MEAPHFIPFREALDLVLAHAEPLGTETLPTERAGGRVLAEAVTAPLDMPPFDNSAMDGWALAWNGDATTAWRIAGEVPAGHMPERPLQPGECMRIFTGAPLPDGADTVVQQEWCNVADGHMRINQGMVSTGINVRGRATHIAAGETAMTPGYFLSPGAIGFAASMGIPSLTVYRAPKVALLVTGSELVAPGQPITGAQIYESNSHTLIAALTESAISPVAVHRVPDEPAAFAKALAEATQAADLVLITGGISVGDHDVARTGLEAAGLETIFYKVKQRPGKPLWFGRSGSTLVFALPGNPASVTSCYYQYVLPAIRRILGHRACELPRVRLPLAAAFHKKPPLTFFLKGKLTEGGALPLEGQLSYIMRSFAEADCLIVLPETQEHFAEGEIVDVQILPHGRP